MNEERNIDPTLVDLLSQHALQSLDAEAAERLQRLLAADPAAARESEELCRVVALLPQVTQRQPPAHLRARVLSAAQNELSQRAARKLGNVSPLVRFRARTLQRWPLVVSVSLAAAAAVACAVLISERAGWAQDRQQWAMERANLERQLQLKTQAASMLLEPNVVKAFMLGASNAAAPGAEGYVLLDLDARRASIAVLDLPPAPAGHSYHLWAVLESKKVACGRFTPAEDGRILTQFAIPVDSYTSPIQRLILTVEPDTDQAAPRGATVMTS